jgi:type IV fimbrial biogenesis protein FimT
MEAAPIERRAPGRVAFAIAIAIGIAALLVTGGIVLSRRVTTASRLSAQANALVADLTFARAQAIKQGRAVVTCASSDGATCSDSNNWQRGWMVCLDANSSDRCDPGDPVYRVQKGFDSGDSFSASGNTSAVQFNREGFSIGLAGTVTITLHDASASRSSTRCVEISAVGTVQLQKAGTGSCR